LLSTAGPMPVADAAVDVVCKLTSVKDFRATLVVKVLFAQTSGPCENLRPPCNV